MAKVTILMPTRNNSAYLPSALDSLLAQTFTDFRLVIVNDGSTDCTAKILDDYQKKDNRVKVVVNNSQLGITRSLNNGLKFATGEYLVRMDSDDWSYPNRIETQVLFMDSNPGIAVSGSWVEICNEDLKVVSTRRFPSKDSDIRKVILRYNPIAHPSTIWRLGKLLAVGGYDESYKYSQDYRAYLMLGRGGMLANTPKVLVKLRKRTGSISVSKGTSQELYALKARLLACLSLRYKTTIVDVVLFVFQLLSLVLIPHKVKMFLFSKFIDKEPV